MPTQDPTTGLRLDNQFAREVQGMYVRWQAALNAGAVATSSWEEAKERIKKNVS